MKSPLYRSAIGGLLATAVVLPVASAVLAAPRKPAPRINVARAKQLYREEGCLDCHKVRGLPGGGAVGPDLSRIGREHSSAEIAKKIRNPKVDNPNSVMPASNLKPADLKILSDWLASLK